MRQQASLECPFARPDHVCGEVLMPVLAQPRGDLGIDLGVLAGEHQQLLDLPARGAVQDLDDLLGRIQVRLVRGERAVLAVAPARP